MQPTSSTTPTTSQTKWWLTADDHTRKAIVLLRVFEKTIRTRVTGYAIVPPEELLKSPKLATAKTLVTWLEEQGYNITLNRLHWQGYLKFAFAQMPSLFLGQLKNPMLFRRYCAQASFRMPPPPSKTAARLNDIYSHVLRPELRGLAARQMLGISETNLRNVLGDDSV